MRILHLCASLNPTTGGPANVLSRLSRTQATGASGHEISIVTTDTPNDPAMEPILTPIQNAGIKIYTAGPVTGLARKGVNVEESINKIIAEGIDIIHCHGLWQHTMHYGAKAAQKAGIPYIFRPAGMLDPWSLAQKKLKKQIFLFLRGKHDLNHAAALHFTTQTEKELVQPLNLKPQSYVIPNGIDWEEEFANLPPTGNFKKQYNIPADAPLIIFLSRLHHKKGLDLLLPAFAQAEIPANTKLALIGPGEPDYIQSLHKEAKHLGINDQLIFTGMLQGIKRIEALVDADLYTLPSYQENFGVSVIEAIAAATPVLISDQVNIHNEVSQAGAGIVVQTRIDSLAIGLTKMLQDTAKLKQMGEIGRKWVHKNFTWTSISQQINQMYNNIIN